METSADAEGVAHLALTILQQFIAACKFHLDLLMSTAMDLLMQMEEAEDVEVLDLGQEAAGVALLLLNKLTTICRLQLAWITEAEAAAVEVAEEVVREAEGDLVCQCSLKLSSLRL